MDTDETILEPYLGGEMVGGGLITQNLQVLELNFICKVLIHLFRIGLKMRWLNSPFLWIILKIFHFSFSKDALVFIIFIGNIQNDTAHSMYHALIGIFFWILLIFGFFIIYKTLENTFSKNL